MAFSTETALAHAWRFEDVNREVASKRLGCSLGDVARELVRLKARYADRRQLDALLDTLPGSSLAVLSLLAENDGMLVEDELMTQARERFALERADVIAGIATLLQHL